MIFLIRWLTILWIYWLCRHSVVRETPIVTQRTREASDMPHAEKRKTSLSGEIISRRYIVAVILNKTRPRKRRSLVASRCCVADIRKLFLVLIFDSWFLSSSFTRLTLTRKTLLKMVKISSKSVHWFSRLARTYRRLSGTLFHTV